MSRCEAEVHTTLESRRLAALCRSTDALIVHPRKTGRPSYSDSPSRAFAADPHDVPVPCPSCPQGTLSGALESRLLAAASFTVSWRLAVADFCDVCLITLCDHCESQTRFRCSEIELEVCDGCLLSLGNGSVWGAGRTSAHTEALAGMQWQFRRISGAGAIGCDNVEP